MKTSRRGFIGGLVGTVAAGPTALAEVARSGLAMSGYGGASLGLYSQSAAGVPYDEGRWIRDELARLQGLSREEKRLASSHMRREVDRIEVDALRSVSLRHKLHMMQERQIEREHQIQIDSLLRRIAEIAAR